MSGTQFWTGMLQRVHEIAPESLIYRYVFPVFLLVAGVAGILKNCCADQLSKRHLETFGYRQVLTADSMLCKQKAVKR